MMKVFISWSGEASRQVAEALREWLPSVIQAVEPWMSTEDIGAGARWISEVARELEEISVGLICLTSHNLSAPWIHFEAGALSKIVKDAFVIPYLLDLEPSDVAGPLAQFQAVRANEEGTKRVVDSINLALGDEGLSDERIDRVFEMWWPALAQQLADVSVATPDGETRDIRSERELLEEVLETVRRIERGRTARSGGAPRDADRPNALLRSSIHEAIRKMGPDSALREKMAVRALRLVREDSSPDAMHMAACVLEALVQTREASPVGDPESLPGGGGAE